MTIVWEIWVLMLLIAILAVLLAPRFILPGPRSAALEGTLLVTGVSPKPEGPDVDGEQYVTIAGVLHGPTVAEHEVYQRLAVAIADWPTVGEFLPVRYAPNNPDNFTFVAPDGRAAG